MQEAMSVTLGRELMLPAYILGSLAELNRQWLGMLGMPAAHDRPLQVPADLLPRFARIDERRRTALAQAPYALFDLRFADDPAWERALTAVYPRVADAVVSGISARQFTQLVIFFAWNVAQVEPRCAPLVLGMSERVAAMLARLTLDRLPDLNGAFCGGLSLRWAASRSYWLPLTSETCPPGSADFRRALLFGVQLAASARLARSDPHPGRERHIRATT